MPSVAGVIAQRLASSLLGSRWSKPTAIDRVRLEWLQCALKAVCSCYLQRNTRRPYFGVFFALKGRKESRYDPKLLVIPIVQLQLITVLSCAPASLTSTDPEF